ncbi:MAG: RIP metalloprotease RseP [Candidatus Omnitrophica bacterium]|nr:RIP metalloprotease RseP [Candidatus Omnitrophota bacterium]
MGPLIAILLLGFLVFVHEAGHFLVARWSGVRILRFSLGFGPKIFGWKRGETEYCVSWIPLGGYVKMAGEQRAEQRQQPWEYLSKPIGTRAMIVFAGPLVNYLTAILSLWVVFMVGYPELLPIVGQVAKDMPAQTAGLQEGDRIRAIGGRPIRTWEEMTELIHAAPGRAVTFQISREGTVRDIEITPKLKGLTDPFGRQQRVGLIGISPSGAFESRRVGPVAAFGRTIEQQNEWLAQTMFALWSLVTGKLSMRESMTGPIGILYLTSEAASMGLAPLLSLMSLFSLSLALFNLFPIPILDGGHLFFLALEKLRGTPVSLNVQERAAQVSFVLLMTLVLVICVNDVNRFGLVDKVLGWFK